MNSSQINTSHSVPNSVTYSPEANNISDNPLLSSIFCDPSGTTDSASESAFFIHNSRNCEFLKRFTCNFDSIQVKTSGNLFGNLPYVN